VWRERLALEVRVEQPRPRQEAREAQRAPPDAARNWGAVRCGAPRRGRQDVREPRGQLGPVARVPVGQRQREVREEAAVAPATL